VGDIRLLETPWKNVGIVARLYISKYFERKIKRRIRRKIIILVMSLKNVLKRMVDMPLLYP
jgi:hypothetical protein